MILTSLFPKMSPAIEDAILEYAPRYGIGEREMPMFLAQAGHESGEFTVFVESLNYSVEALIKTFGRHRISLEDAAKFGRGGGRVADQQAIANRLYGGEWGRKNLGNTMPGDGWKYRGRGIFQLTGRANYQRFQDAHPDIKVINHPDLLTQPAEAVISACWFWQTNNLNAVATDIVMATKRINGGQIGLDHRKKLFDSAKQMLA